MHRSGTSLVAKVLEKADIFMGVIKDHNYEAMHFLSLNQQTLWAAQANWISPIVPDPIYWKAMPAETLFHEHFRTYGRWKQLILSIQSPTWGWKDPRNTFTLPMWLSIFPTAKVIHVIRNEDDVAKSLAQRNLAKGEVHDSRFDDLNFGRALAQKYVNQGRSYQSQLNHRYIEINYEDLVKLEKKPISALEKFTDRKLMSLFKEYIIT
jgi:hypothetical protein